MTDRIHGCMLGGAVGDALGAPIEFMSLDEIRRRFGPQGVTGYEPAYGRRGAFTDDTQMALFTAEGCIRARRHSENHGSGHPARVLRRAYLRWLHTQGEPIERIRSLDDLETDPPGGWLVRQDVLHSRRAPGNTCLSSLRDPRRLMRAENDSKGCGGVMRIAPVGLVSTDPFSEGCDFAAITHGHPTGWLAAGAMAVIVSRLLAGETLDVALDAAEAKLASEPGRDETLDALTAARRRAARDMSSGATPSAESVESLGEGWIAEEALAIAVYCALVAEDFASGVLLAVNHGGDCDSTGAIAGNLLGTQLGVGAIPVEWLEQLEGRDIIESLADDLAGLTGIGGKAHGVLDDARYPPW